MTFESSNTKMLEKMTTEQVIRTVRNAMKAGCISPCHVYDAVDELICRLAKKEGISAQAFGNDEEGR